MQTAGWDLGRNQDWHVLTSSSRVRCVCARASWGRQQHRAKRCFSSYRPNVNKSRGEFFFFFLVSRSPLLCYTRRAESSCSHVECECGIKQRHVVVWVGFVMVVGSFLSACCWLRQRQYRKCFSRHYQSETYSPTLRLNQNLTVSHVADAFQCSY